MDKGQIQGRKETTSKVLSYSLEERRCNLWAKNEKRCFRSQQCTKMELFFFFCVCLFACFTVLPKTRPTQSHHTEAPCT